MIDKSCGREVNVIHIIPDGDVSVGGAAIASVRLAHEQARLGAKVYIIELNSYFDKSKPWSNQDTIYINNCLKSSIWVAFVKVLKLCLTSDCVFHFHGIWFPKFILFYLAARISNSDYIISPHGSLEVGALKQKYWKKYFARRLFFNLFCRGAAAMMACSEKEKNSIKMLFPNTTIHVVPIGVDIPFYKSRILIKDRCSDHKNILVISRITPGKGILNLIHAWDNIRNDEWRIIIAGPDEHGYQSELENDIKLLNLDSYFTFLGYVDEHERDELYRRADLFVLPSLSENFGIVVAEAMSYGVPVLTTNETPWGQIGLRRGCLCVGASPKELTEGLHRMMKLDETEHAKIATEARSFIKNNFVWDVAAKASMKAYEIKT